MLACKMLPRKVLAPVSAPRRAPAPTRSIATRAGSKADELADKAAGLFGKLENVVSGMSAEASSLAAKAKQVDVQGFKDQAKGALNTSASAIQGSLDAVLAEWAKFDADGDGKLSPAEAVALLNSAEVSAIVKKATGLEHTQRTEADIAKWFKRADFDRSGSLSKREFALFYVGLLADKAKMGAGALASAVAAALDKDGDGKIGSTELKGLLNAVHLGVVANLVPEGRDIDYRGLLSKVQG